MNNTIETEKEILKEVNTLCNNLTEREILKEVKILCDDLIKWRLSPDNQTYHLIFEIHHNAQALEDDKNNYKQFSQINFNEILSKYDEFKIDEITNFKWVNDYCLKYLYYYSEANLKFDITNGGI